MSNILQIQRLKKTMATLLVICLLATLVTFEMPAITAQAAKATSTIIKAGKTYKIDLDGDKKKEKIYVKESKGDYDNETNFTLYINDKKVKSAISGYKLHCKVIDIDTSKKGKELIYFIESPASDCLYDGGGIYKYKDGKLKTLLSFDNGKYYYIWRIIKGCSTNGKGKLCVVADTPLEINAGSYHAKLTYIYKDNKLEPKKTLEFYGELSRGFTCELAKKVKLYKKPSKKSTVIKKLVVGTKLNILKVKFTKIKSETDEYGYTHQRAIGVYAYIKTTSDKKGWIYLPANYSLFYEYPWVPG